MPGPRSATSRYGRPDGSSTPHESSTAIAPAAALAQSKEVHLLSWGGTFQTMLEKEGWADRFRKETGYTLTLVPKATSSEIIATAIAQKDNPQVDVVMADQAAVQQGIQQGIFADLNESDVPNLAKMADNASIGTQAISPYADILAIVYNKDVFERNGWAPPLKARFGLFMIGGGGIATSSTK